MAYVHITDGTATVVAKDRTRTALIQVNNALTGTIAVEDSNGSATTPLVATITNPAVGNQFVYHDFQNGVKIVASGSCDITVSTSSSYGPW